MEAPDSKADFYVNPAPLLKRFVLVDDFYQFPDKVRETALRMPYDRSDEKFPGLRTVDPFIPLGVRDFFERRIGVNWRSTEDAQTSNGCFQIMLEADGPNSYVHPDHKTELAGLVYLSPGHEGEPGTAFYKHRRFGISEFPDTQAAIEVAHQHRLTVEELMAVLRGDRFNLDAWEMLYMLPFRYNRMVVYRSKLFHKNASAWGVDTESGRLIHSFFLKAGP